MIGVLLIHCNKAVFKKFNTFEEAQEYVNMVVHTEAYIFNLMKGDLL